MDRVSTPGAPPINRLQALQCRSIMASRFISKLARSRPPCASLSYMISASKCISKLAPLRPPSASPNSFDYILQVHLWVHSIMASQCISKLARSWPPCASLSYMISASKCISKLARSRPPSASSNSFDYILEVYLWVHWIIASKCISKFTQ